ncbi:hypothetical protein [Agrobacterium cavarae]|uniref:hypothetical protein n=1 Tax=Agrobacterium cavarae TaxID=2528239 RepID=UPI003AB97911
MAKLLVAWKPIWILDEPTAALDAEADRMFTGLVKAHLVKGGMVIAATHQPLGLEEAKELRMTGFAGVEEGILMGSFVTHLRRRQYPPLPCRASPLKGGDRTHGTVSPISSLEDGVESPPLADLPP